MPKDAKAKVSYPEPYWKQRQALKLKAPHSDQEKKEEKSKKKDDLKVYYAAQALAAPSKCENCGRNLQATINFHPRAHIAHIIPKTKQGGCPSIATHPQNKWFGCLDCHTFYDKSYFQHDYDIIEQMPVWPKLIERFKLFKQEIKQAEMKNVLIVFYHGIAEAPNHDQPGKRKRTKGKG